MTMTTEAWDPDQAVTRGLLDEALEGTCTIDRYGLTEWEGITGEPLSVALAQEEPDSIDDGFDDDWALVDPGQDGFAIAAGSAPEELAMHLVLVAQ